MTCCKPVFKRRFRERWSFDECFGAVVWDGKINLLSGIEKKHLLAFACLLERARLESPAEDHGHRRPTPLEAWQTAWLAGAGSVDLQAADVLVR